jgi:hypothetical protein
MIDEATGTSKFWADWVQQEEEGWTKVRGKRGGNNKGRDRDSWRKKEK